MFFFMGMTILIIFFFFLCFSWCKKKKKIEIFENLLSMIKKKKIKILFLPTALCDTATHTPKFNLDMCVGGASILLQFIFYFLERYIRGAGAKIPM